MRHIEDELSMSGSKLGGTRRYIYYTRETVARVAERIVQAEEGDHITVGREFVSADVRFDIDRGGGEGYDCCLLREGLVVGF